jgi:iron complex transport system substrate-binding protein
VIKRFLLCITVVLLLSSCSQKTAKTFVDREGNTVSISGEINKIISAAPSNTEIIIDLGLADKLVAVDKYSLEVEGVDQNLPLIDFFFPDAEAILGINPDVIISHGHNNLGAGDDPFKLIREAGIPVVYIPVSSDIDDICRDIEFIADVLNVSDRGKALTASMRRQLEEIAAIGRTIEDKKTVYFEISSDPNPASIGRDSYLDHFITIIGAQNIFADQNGIVFPGVESILNRNPEVIVTVTNDQYDPVEKMKARDGFEHVTAVKDDAIYLVDADSTLRPSTHILVALKQMAKAVYPDKYETL